MVAFVVTLVLVSGCVVGVSVVVALVVVSGLVVGVSVVVCSGVGIGFPKTRKNNLRRSYIKNENKNKINE